MRTMLVGRHVSDLPSEFEIIVQENVTFSLDRAEVKEQVLALVQRAKDLNVGAIIFQNTPGILGVALGELHRSPSGEWLPLERQLGVKVGVIISRPGPRLAGVAKTFVFATLPEATYAPTNSALAAEAVTFANSRAKVTIKTVDGWTDEMRVEVDPISPFTLDHIEWM